MHFKICHCTQQVTIKRQYFLGAKWPNRICPAGIDIDHAAGLLYVVTKENNTLYIVDPATKKNVVTGNTWQRSLRLFAFTG